MVTSSKSTAPAARRRARREEAAELREQGRSTRAIADVLNCSTWTVRDDLKKAGKWDPTLVTGRDGKTYPANAAERKKRRAEKLKAEQEAAEQEPAGPVTLRCRYCTFTAVVDADNARQAFAEHVCDRPPPPAKSARSCPRRRGWRTGK